MTEQQPAAPAPICPEQAEELAKLAVSSYRAHLSAGVHSYEAAERAAAVVRTRVAEGWAPQCEVSSVLVHQGEQIDRLTAVLEAARRRVRGERWLVGAGDELTDTVAAYDRLAEGAAGPSEARQ